MNEDLNDEEEEDMVFTQANPTPEDDDDDEEEVEGEEEMGVREEETDYFFGMKIDRVRKRRKLNSSGEYGCFDLLVSETEVSSIF